MTHDRRVGAPAPDGRQRLGGLASTDAACFTRFLSFSSAFRNDHQQFWGSPQSDDQEDNATQ